MIRVIATINRRLGVYLQCTKVSDLQIDQHFSGKVDRSINGDPDGLRPVEGVMVFELSVALHIPQWMENEAVIQHDANGGITVIILYTEL